MDMIATSVVPPPISTIIFASSFSMGKPAPMDAAIGSPRRRTSLAPALIAESLTALFSTAVIPEGTAMTTRGGTSFRLSTFSMKYLNMASEISKSAITPSFIGRRASMVPGVRPSILFASAPTAQTFLLVLYLATTLGSRKTMHRSLTKTKVFAVPRSMPMSLERNPKRLPIICVIPVRLCFASELTIVSKRNNSQ